MQEIKLLENNVINKIAAGEVIERPASIVKELVENSIDAGATNITIEVKNGGTSLIKITDNGSGIKKNQVKIAFLRHSTSKLEKFTDLDSILTLGFRGEALASIASISQVEIITKTKDENIGTKLCINGGDIIEEEDIACLDGTSFTVKNIFFNTPARRKFLKKDSVESGYISEMVNRLALGHPNISFKYINNTATMLQTSGNNDIKNTVFNIYGKDVAQKMLPIKDSKKGYTIIGLIGLPELTRGNRNYQNFFINGRYIKSSIVTNSIEDAYWGKIMTHKFPVFVINLIAPENTVDVNVHPTKLEVRFENEDFIFKFIKNSVEKVLSTQTLIPEVKSNFESFSSVTNKEPFNIKKQNTLEELLLTEEYDDYQSFQAVEYRNSPIPPNIDFVGESTLASIESEFNDFNLTSNENKTVDYDISKIDIKEFPKTDLILNETTSLKSKPEIKNTELASLISVLPETKDKSFQNNVELKQRTKKSFFNNYKIIGQIFNTYWIIEQNQEIFMIDQHAAHEKIIYEDFIKKFKNSKITSQRLLQPLIINVSEIEKNTIEENLQLLSNFGFNIELFGLNSYAVREVPFIFKNAVEPQFLIEVLDLLMDKNISSVYDLKLEKIASMSCKKAVKANDKLSYLEAKSLIEQILTLENPFNCPHGRPTIIKMTKYEIEKLFKRIQN